MRWLGNCSIDINVVICIDTAMHDSTVTAYIDIYIGIGIDVKNDLRRAVSVYAGVTA